MLKNWLMRNNDFNLLNYSSYFFHIVKHSTEFVPITAAVFLFWIKVN